MAGDETKEDFGQSNREPEVWQVAAGKRSRHYEDIFYDWGIATIGPGWEGEWDAVKCSKPEVISRLKEDGEKTPVVLENFASKVMPGDYIILKIGLEPIAIGEVQEYKDGKAYFWNECFRLVDGWDLGHCIKVKWRKLAKGDLTLTKELTQSKFQKTHYDKQKIIDTFKNGQTELSKSVQDIERLTAPKESGENEFKNQLEEELQKRYQTSTDNFKDRVNVIWKTILKLKDTAKEFEIAEGSEEEAKIFFIVPLLQSLGWTYKNISIEHHEIDLALSYSGFNSRDFDKEKENMNIIIEAKHVGGGLENAKKQADEYRKRGLTNLKQFVVSNGINYYTYISKDVKNPDDEWKKSAYLDIKNLWIDGPRYRPDVKGAIELLAQLYHHQN